MSRATRQRLNTTAELACVLAALSAAGLWTRVPEAAWTDTVWTSLALLCVFAGCWVVAARPSVIKLMPVPENAAEKLLASISLVVCSSSADAPGRDKEPVITAAPPPSAGPPGGGASG